MGERLANASSSISVQHQYRMKIEREQVDELNGLIEDMVANFCDEHMISGQTAWTCVEIFAMCKTLELAGILVTD